MTITNRTHWQTRDLRAIINLVVAEELEGSGRVEWQRRHLRVEIVYARSSHVSGCATIRGLDATLRIPRDVVDPVAFAWLCAHEFAHTRGMRHRQMPAWLMWKTTSACERYAWAASMPIRRVEPKPVPTADEKRAAALAHVQVMRAKAETRVKRATTILKTWQRREARLLRQSVPLAAGTGRIPSS